MLSPVGEPEPDLQVEIDAEPDPEEFYRTVIVPKEQDYYLSRFAKFDGNGKAGASWHWPAFFVSFYWFLYRKMWFNALLYFLLPYIVLSILGIIAALAAKKRVVASGVSGTSWASLRSSSVAG